MSPKYAETLLSYDYWANTRVINAIEQFVPEVPDNLLETLSHIIGAKQIWYNRVINIPVSKDLMKKEELNILKLNNESLHKIWIELVHRNSPNEFVINYKNLAGDPFSNSLAEVITHLSHHGTYHRGQISKSIRELEKEPIASDFIVFCRHFPSR